MSRNIAFIASFIGAGLAVGLIHENETLKNTIANPPLNVTAKIDRNKSLNYAIIGLSAIAFIYGLFSE
jgi:hypothetical protein